MRTHCVDCLTENDNMPWHCEDCFSSNYYHGFEDGEAEKEKEIENKLRQLTLPEIPDK